MTLFPALLAAFTISGAAHGALARPADLHIDLRWTQALIELRTGDEITPAEQETWRGRFMMALNVAAATADDDLRVSARIGFGPQLITITTTLPTGQELSTKYVRAARISSVEPERATSVAFEQPYASSYVGGCLQCGLSLSGGADRLREENHKEQVRQRQRWEHAAEEAVRAAARQHVGALFERLDRKSVVRFSDAAFSMDDHPELRARLLHILNGPRAATAETPLASTALTETTAGTRTVFTMTTRLPSRRMVVTQREDRNEAEGRLRTAWLHAQDVAAAAAPALDTPLTLP
ncbi:MAG: hypothetical protein Q8O67_07675 [Deltaproteobacteria bacterium]|nr:hypothetical protein [Deltaproteobacteria bacterium]